MFMEAKPSWVLEAELGTVQYSPGSVTVYNLLHILISSSPPSSLLSPPLRSPPSSSSPFLLREVKFSHAYEPLLAYQGISKTRCQAAHLGERDQDVRKESDAVLAPAVRRSYQMVLLFISG